MKVLSLKSTVRNGIGKSAARSLRRDGLIPATLYGPKLDSVNLSVESIDFYKLLRGSKTGQFLLNLNIGEIDKKVTIKKIQRSPVSSDILHIDFYEVDMNKKIKLKVPIATFGKPKGIDFGGILQIIRREVEIMCFPSNIPESVVVDLSDLDVGDSFHVNDLVLPNEVEIVGSNFTILTISKKILEEESSNDDKSDDNISENSDIDEVS